MTSFDRGAARAGVEDSGNGAGPRHGTIKRESVRQVYTEQAAIEQAAVLQLEAGTVHAGRSAIGALRAQRATVRDSAVAAMATVSAACDGARVGVLAAPVVRGEVHTWLDLRTAFAVGLGLAAGSFALSLARRLFR